MKLAATWQADCNGLKPFLSAASWFLMSLSQREMTFTAKIDKQKILCQKLKMHFDIFSGNPD